MTLPPEAALRRDVRLLGETLGRVLVEQGGKGLLHDEERIRELSRRARASGSAAARSRLADAVASLALERQGEVLRAFSMYFQLANLAEQHHRLRRRREYEHEQRVPRESLAEAFSRFERAGVSARQLAAAGRRLSLELVLTAHPTEATRRTVLAAQLRLDRWLDRLDDPTLQRSGREEALDAIAEEVTALWQTDEVRSHRPRVVDEVRHGLWFFETSLLDVAPELVADLRRRLPSAEAPLRFGSWIGGDQDGNPAVDVVFPLLHGPWGEDGTIQGLLEMAGVRYVGAGRARLRGRHGQALHEGRARGRRPAGAARTTVITPREWERDPAACRERGRGARLPGVREAGPRRLEHRHQQGARRRRARRRDRGGPPPRPQGARRGRGRGRPRGRVRRARRRSTAPPETSVPAEIRVGGDHEFYDFAAKYLPEEHTELDVPADLPDDVDRAAARAGRAGVRGAVGCEGLARVDFFVLPDGALVINEINTMPGFTPTSMFPRMWAATGLDYPALVDRLVQLALHRDTGLR